MNFTFHLCRIYPQEGFANLLNSNNTPKNFHLVGNTRNSTTNSPNDPSLKRTGPFDKETIVVDADETNEDERTERRLNYTKDEDVRLVSNFPYCCQIYLQSNISI
jgi:hypothetical protein